MLQRDGVCQDPERRHPGEAREATVADHVVPVRVFAAHGEPEGAWTLENGQGLCASCHGAKTRRGA